MMECGHEPNRHGDAPVVPVAIKVVEEAGRVDEGDDARVEEQHLLEGRGVHGVGLGRVAPQPPVRDVQVPEAVLEEGVPPQHAGQAQDLAVNGWRAGGRTCR